MYLHFEGQIFSKGEAEEYYPRRIHTFGSPPSHLPGTDCPVFDVQCSLVNVTRCGTIINVCSCNLQIVSHMSILNILLINFFIMRSILFHNKARSLVVPLAFQDNILHYILHWTPLNCNSSNNWVYQKATRKFIAKTLYKIEMFWERTENILF